MELTKKYRETNPINWEVGERVISKGGTVQHIELDRISSTSIMTQGTYEQMEKISKELEDKNTIYVVTSNSFCDQTIEGDGIYISPDFGLFELGKTYCSYSSMECANKGRLIKAVSEDGKYKINACCNILKKVD